MLKLKWTELALGDIDGIFEFIPDNPLVAKKIANEIWQSANRLLDNPQIGRAGRVSGTKEWVVTNYKYTIAYRVRNGYLEIIRVLPDRKLWPVDLEDKD